MFTAGVQRYRPSTQSSDHRRTTDPIAGHQVSPRAKQEFTTPGQHQTRQADNVLTARRPPGVTASLCLCFLNPLATRSANDAFARIEAVQSPARGKPKTEKTE